MPRGQAEEQVQLQQGAAARDQRRQRAALRKA